MYYDDMDGKDCSLNPYEVEEIMSSLPEEVFQEDVIEIFFMVCKVYNIPIDEATTIGINILHKLCNVLHCENEGETVH